MSETGLATFQLTEFLPAIEAFILLSAIGLGAISVKALWCKCKK